MHENSGWAGENVERRTSREERGGRWSRHHQLCFFIVFMQSYYRLIWIINRAARGTWSHTTHAKNAELLWRQNKTIQGEAGGSNVGLSPWMEGNNGTKKTRYKAAPAGNRSVIWGSWAKVCIAQSIAGESNLESVERKVSNNYIDVSSWRFYKPPDVSEVDGPQVWGDQTRIFFTGSSTIAIRDCGDQFFKPSHDVSLTLSVFFMPKPNQSTSTALWQEWQRKCDPNKRKVATQRCVSFKISVAFALNIYSGDWVGCQSPENLHSCFNRGFVSLLLFYMSSWNGRTAGR